jgi:hypothetical protein
MNSFALGLLCAALLSFTFAQVQSVVCDPLAVPSQESAHPYSVVEDRCEGKVVRLSFSKRLELLSFTDAFQTLPVEDSAFHLSWEAVDFPQEVQEGLDGSLSVKVQPTQLDCLYQMDAPQTLEAVSYTWPTTVAKSVGIKTTKDLGVTVFARDKDGTPLYLPARFSTTPVEQSGSYTFTILPGSDLAGVYLTLVQLDVQGKPVQVLLEQEEFLGGPFFSLQPFDIPLGKTILPEPGLYELTVAAVIEGTTPAATPPLRFYHPGE